MSRDPCDCPCTIFDLHLLLDYDIYVFIYVLNSFEYMIRYHSYLHYLATRHIPDFGLKVKFETGSHRKPRIVNELIGHILDIGEHKVLKKE